MKFNPLDIFIDITQGFDWLWEHQTKLCYGLVALSAGLMIWGLLASALWPFVAGIGVCCGSIAAAYVIGRES